MLNLFNISNPRAVSFIRKVLVLFVISQATNAQDNNANIEQYLLTNLWKWQLTPVSEELVILFETNYLMEMSPNTELSLTIDYQYFSKSLKVKEKYKVKQTINDSKLEIS